MAQATSVERPAGAGSRRARRSSGAESRRPRLHLGRLAILVLVLIAVSFYLGPLRQFFTQQDRYQKEVAALETARSEQALLKRQVQLLNTDAYIEQRALSRSGLVPPDTQLFVIKGLPDRAEEEAARTETLPPADSFSVLDRVEDLWRTLLH